VALSNAWERCNDLPDRTSWFLVGPQPMSFPASAIIDPLPRAPKGASNIRRFFCFGEPAEGFGSLYLYVSMYCFLTCLGYIILGPRRGGLFLWIWGV